ncbi:MAG: zinc-ribbon domain-containing protein [Proteobacteria bacterium]|nr:zinc-ribbon domain-containing protein [Pseudomonadota bacterium]MBU1059623.1 zinc-ribbon domain-containing protein [Pseudomonadota bacterium]
MKIDCPHCGVHGSIDDSLAGKKLRCPKCSKVFLIAEEFLPEPDTAELLRQEVLSDDEGQFPVAREEVSSALQETEESAEGGDKEERAGVAEAVAEDEVTSQVCSDCGQTFAPEFLEEIDSRLYCALCKPEVEAEEREPQDQGEAFVAAEEESEEYLAEENPEFETCSGCGELLHPELLQTVSSKRYCALCLPEEGAREEADAEAEATAVDIAADEGAMVAKTATVASLLTEKVVAEESFLEVCSGCGERFHPDFLQEIDSRLYCGVCQSENLEEASDTEGESSSVASERMADADTEVDEEEASAVPDFTVGEVLKEAWEKTKGAKAAIWGGLCVMYLVLFVLIFGPVFGLQGLLVDMEPTMVIGINAGLQLVATWFSVVFTAGIMLMGVRRAAEEDISWKMVFTGFTKALSITIALVLQTVLILIGFCLLVLPGIYLSVGYALTLPLILEKGLGPWQALEVSRKAIHKKWWTVFGLYLVMGLIYLVSTIPLGLGMIWTVPMFFVGLGILYRLFFGSAGAEEEVLSEG